MKHADKETTMFLTDDERAETIRACRFCPMCYCADTVAQVLRKETHTPRGRGLTLFAVERGLLDWSPDVVESMYRHSTDGLDQEWCVGNYDHDELVLWARAEIVKAKRAPDAVNRALQNLRASGNPWGIAEPSDGGAAPSGNACAILDPTIRIKRPGIARELFAIGVKAGRPLGALAHEGCCGHLAYQLGDLELAEMQVKALAAAVAEQGARELVVPDADCFRFLEQRGRRFGAEWPAGLEILHSSQWLAQLVAEGRLTLRASFGPSPRRVAYHDPCSLARFTRVIDAPRQVLTAIEGLDVVEFPWARERARCCGGGGGLPVTNPDVTRAASARRIAELEPKSVDAIVSACATCEESLAAAAADAGAAVVDLVEIVAASMV
jgi:Fe-S oxidoreductase